jgi:hypothetical protein
MTVTNGLRPILFAGFEDVRISVSVWGSRCGWSLAHRYSIETFRPSM